MMLTHGGLFEGVAGFGLGARRAGFNSIFAVERNKYKQQIIHQHFPNCQIYGNIQTAKNLPFVDVLTGGFPCQNISLAGIKTGIIGDQSGLWSEFFRVIKETKPGYIIIENSSNLLNAGIEYILYDLASIGYDAEWTIISCKQFGLRQLRKRLFIIAYPMQERRSKRKVSIFRSIPEIFQQKEISEQANIPMLLERFDGHTNKSLLRANTRLSNGLDINRIESIGDSVSPYITEYLFNCIKFHYHDNNP